ncbi:MAG: BlaI/MecI/CopY family transcriptional regulator [Acidobacteria bacterium]|nr:BlaI/MecI/CopY family transcriptional regulator [Acidobacteriota bacterium]
MTHGDNPPGLSLEAAPANRGARGEGRVPVGRKTIYELPPLELECMKVLWRLGEASVREIREQLAATRPLAYTTVETIMDRLTRKAMVSRQKVGKAHRYTPRYERGQARTQAVQALVEHFFGGSRAALRDYLEGLPESGLPVSEPAPIAAGKPAAGSVRPRSATSTRSAKRTAASEPPEPPLDITLL